MAVRNLEGIKRCEAALAEKKSNERKRREEFTKKRFCRILECANDAKDAEDTLHEVWRRGFSPNFRENEKKYLGFRYDESLESFYLYRKYPSGRHSDTIEVGYIPHLNKVYAYKYYGWGGHASYKFGIADIEKATETFYGNEDFNELLTQFADSFASFLKVFFSWVESL